MSRALTACASHLARYGGHPMAAGLTVDRDKLPAFKEAFHAVARARLSPEDLVDDLLDNVPRAFIDAAPEEVWPTDVM